MSVPRYVHMVAGITPAGGRVRAVCSCGHATTPRVNEQAAVRALQSEHGFTRQQCQLCGRDYDDLTWEQLRAAVEVLDAGDIGQVEQFMVCRNMPQACRDGAAQAQVHLDRAAGNALGVDMPAPRLRIVRSTDLPATESTEDQP